MIVRAIPTPAIALTMTMPHAWLNINTAALLPRRRDPIRTTCDIQATPCARRRTDAGAARRGVASPGRNFAIEVLPNPRATRQRASNLLAAEFCSALRTPPGDRAFAKAHAGSLPHFAATVAREDVIEPAAP
jgi:hypothetical protein